MRKATLGDLQESLAQLLMIQLMRSQITEVMTAPQGFFF